LSQSRTALVAAMRAGGGGHAQAQPLAARLRGWLAGAGKLFGGGSAPAVGDTAARDEPRQPSAAGAGGAARRGSLGGGVRDQVTHAAPPSAQRVLCRAYRGALTCTRCWQLGTAPAGCAAGLDAAAPPCLPRPQCVGAFCLADAQVRLSAGRACRALGMAPCVSTAAVPVPTSVQLTRLRLLTRVCACACTADPSARGLCAAAPAGR